VSGPEVTDAVTPAGTDRLAIRGLCARAGGREVLHGIDLDVGPGEVHAVMGPNGSGKSTLAHALIGRPGVEVTEGSVTIGGRELLSLPTWMRARAGLFVALQHPVEVVGVQLEALIAEASDTPDREELRDRLRREARRIGLSEALLDRPVNVDLSGGERKRNETLQLGVLQPRYAVLDEIDSGLDVDALRAVARRIEDATTEWGLGVLAVTHFPRLLSVLHADRVHVLVDGRIAASGGSELAQELEGSGYQAYLGR